MFTTYAEVDNSTRKRLREYMKYIDDGNLNEKILSDPVYGPTQFWEGICKNTFIGFSSSRICIESGFDYANSIYSSRIRLDVPFIRSAWQNFLQFMNAARHVRSSDFNTLKRDYLKYH